MWFIWTQWVSWPGGGVAANVEFDDGVDQQREGDEKTPRSDEGWTPPNHQSLNTSEIWRSGATAVDAHVAVGPGVYWSMIGHGAHHRRLERVPGRC